MALINHFITINIKLELLFSSNFSLIMTTSFNHLLDMCNQIKTNLMIYFYFVQIKNLFFFKYSLR